MNKKMKAFTKYHEVFQNDDSEINMNLVREKSKLLSLNKQRHYRASDYS